MNTRYVDLLTDFGFKRLFEDEARLIKLLNEIVPASDRVLSLQFQSVEQTRFMEDDKTIIYDIYCRTLDGREIIVEIQRSKHKFFVDRALYYVARAIDRQLVKGTKAFELSPTYLVAFCDFEIFEQSEEYHQVVELKTQHNALFTDKLRFHFFDLKKVMMSSPAKELSSLEQWVRAIKTMGTATEVPDWVTDKDVRKLYEVAEVSNLSREERAEYESELNRIRDLQSAFQYNLEEGMSKGMSKGITKGIAKGIAKGEAIATKKIAISMHESGITPQQIAKILKLELSEVESLLA